MKTRNSAAFTLLELVVVLAILSIVTVLAVRSLSSVEDQRRYEASQRGLQEISDAVLGSPDDRAADGSRTISGFVADTGRLPHTIAETINGQSLLTLGELWKSGIISGFDVRPATIAHGVSADDEDSDVLVPGGWRGTACAPAPRSQRDVTRRLG